MAELPNPVSLARQIAQEVGRRAVDAILAVERRVRARWLRDYD